MAGRDKKAKNLPTSTSSRESPSTSSKRTPPAALVAAAEGREAADRGGSPADGKRGAVLKAKAAKKKMNPATKINIARGRKKTKANFKLSIVKTQGMIVKKGRRGRPPLKKPLVKVNDPEETEDDPAAPEATAKTRGRKKANPDSVAQEVDKIKTGESTEATAKDGQIKKTLLKGAPRKIIKKNPPLGVNKAMTKKKMLMAERALKADGEIVPKSLKSSLTSKLKPAIDRVESKKDPPEQNKTKSESIETALSAVDIKKESDVEAPSPVTDSGTTSPRPGGVRKLRKSSDLISVKSLPADSSASSPGAKSPYSTRSDRSKSPFPLKKEAAQKILRNGKQRKLTDSLLAETVEQQFKKRRRVHSDSRDSRISDVGIESISEAKKAKKPRSYSRDGSEISKCSDITESDISFCDTMSIDADLSKVAIKKELSHDDLPNDELVPKEDNFSNIIIDTASMLEESPAPIGVSMDNENNNTDGKNKTDPPVDKLSNTDEPSDDALNPNQERIAEKSLILDNMSKTFNFSLADKANSIRRSARQRKSTVKAKEHEETVMAEKDALDFADFKMSAGKVIRSDSEDCTTDASKTCTPSAISPALEPGITKRLEPSSESAAVKITAKKFYGDSNQTNTSTDKKSKDPKAKAVNENATESWLDGDRQVSTVNNFVDNSVTKLGFDDADNNLEFDSCPVDDSVKENIESAYTAKAFSNQDIDKLIDKLKVFEAQDKKRQEENLRANASGKSSVMVTNDVVLISKSNADHIALKDIPNTVTIDKPKEKAAVLSRFENNSAISLIKKDQPRKSFEIELSSGVTLIKRTGTNSRKHSTGSNPKEDSVTMFDKALGKEVTLELRKSIDKVADASLMIAKTQLPNAANKAVSISLKPNPSSITVETPLLSPNDDSMKVVSLKEVSVTEVSPKEAPVAIVSTIEAKIVVPSKEASAREALTKLPITKEVSCITSLVKELVPVMAVPKDITIKDVQPQSTTPKEVASKVLPTKTVPAKDASLKIVPSKESTTKVVPVKESTPKSITAKGLTTKEATSKVVTSKASAVKGGTIKDTVAKVPLAKHAPIKEAATKAVTPKDVPVKDKEKMEALVPPVVTPEIISQNLEAATSVVPEIVNSNITTDSLPSVQFNSSTVSEKAVSVPPIVTVAVSKRPIASLSSMALPLVTAAVPLEVKPPLLSLPSGKAVPEETPENLKRKEMILSSLGLLTHKAADEAKLEKQKQKELLIKTNKTAPPKLNTNDGYTGTLKTVIKLNRAGLDKKKGRSPLKMTFQKSKSRGNKSLSDGLSGDSESDENSYYTIYKEFGGSSAPGSGSSENHLTSGGHRKTHYSNRFNNHDLASHDPLDVAVEPNPAGKEATLNLVIPEKASSFAIHPERVCKDQCFYCGGKFGLFDTPCHVAQIKSLDRQKKILDNEEKLSSDSCLCDACYRHVDRRANCPSYRKRAGPGAATAPAPPPGTAGDMCHAFACNRPAPHTIRRKWLVKMRKSISKVVQLDLDYPGLHTIPLCDVHYEAVSHLMVCGLCKKKLSKNHVHYINQEYQALNTLLHEQGVPVVFEEKPVVCKSCREFCTMLLRPPAQNQQKPFLLKNYRRRLLMAHNLETVDKMEMDPSEYDMSEAERGSVDPFKESRKGKNGKSKTKKSSDGRKASDENNSSNGSDTHSKDLRKSSEAWRNSNQEKSAHGKDAQPAKPMEEDIESLISSNKIPVPGSASARTGDSGENSDADYDNSLELLGASGMDNQSELQYLLQKCNVPRSTVLYRGNVPNLTQKSKNILKAQNAPAIFKASHGQKITDKNAKRIQKLGQIITQKTESELDMFKDRDGLPLEAVSVTIMGEEAESCRDGYGFSIPRNIALNDECTIETVPMKGGVPRSCKLNPSKARLQLNDGFSRVIKNLNTLSAEQIKKKQVNRTDSRFSNPVRRLETNPSISVRELFPGEEEMNLQGSVEFNNSKGVTPEGWERCNSTIQYDADTKRLWHELQKPYGNQSSFLRHLLLLEKYFRNGDLVLSRRADCNAVTYSDSVQNRLRSYDNIPSGCDRSLSAALRLALPKNSSVTVTPHTVSPPPPLPPETVLETVKRTDSVSLIDFRKQKNPSGTGKSLLKTNQNSTYDLSKAVSARLLPPPQPLPHIVNQAKIPKNVPLSIAQINQSVDRVPNASMLPKNLPMSLAQFEKFTVPPPPSTVPRPPTPRPEFNFPRPSIPLPATMPEAKTSSAGGKTRAFSLPPELIAIPNPRKSLDNVLRNIQQLAKGAAVPDRPTSVAADSGTSAAPVAPVVSDTSSLTADPPKKAKGSSKQWRPTLIPITDESKARNSRDVLYQTADGRRLPSLVQVMSGGKPYYITIQDYNRMCVMRRQKLQQMQKAELTGKSGAQTSSPSSQPEGSELAPAVRLLSDCESPSSGRLLSTPETPAQKIKPLPSETSDQNNSVSAGIRPAAPRPVDVDPSPSITPSTESCATMLKNVGLKNITIGPVRVSSPGETKMQKSVPATVTSQSLLLPEGIAARLDPSTTAALESANKSIAALAAMSPKPVAVASKAISMPKLPTSLTVIPQMAGSPLGFPGAASVMPILPPIKLLPLPAPLPPLPTLKPPEP